MYFDEKHFRKWLQSQIRADEPPSTFNFKTLTSQKCCRSSVERLAQTSHYFSTIIWKILKNVIMDSRHSIRTPSLIEETSANTFCSSRTCKNQTLECAWVRLQTDDELRTLAQIQRRHSNPSTHVQHHLGICNCKFGWIRIAKWMLRFLSQYRDRFAT